MPVDLDAPADTTMMGVVHDALRRDLARLGVVLAEIPPPDPEQRVAVAAHVGWLMEFLHHHHQGEDRGLWPVVQRLNPDAADLLDRMNADHHRIQPGIARIGAAAAAYGQAGGEAERAELAAALEELSGSLLPHLRAEEDEAMPVVSASITQRHWNEYDQEHNLKGKGLLQLADEGHWLMDSLDPRRREVLVHLVPAPVRFVILKGFARRYRVACRRRWGAGVAVGPSPR